MSQLADLTYALTRKLREWPQNETHAKIIIDTFVEFMDATDWDDEDKLTILSRCKDSIPTEFIRKQLESQMAEIQSRKN